MYLDHNGGERTRNIVFQCNGSKTRSTLSVVIVFLIQLQSNTPLWCSLKLDKLQRTQNAAARVLSKTRKYDHITPTLIELHWLPVRQRIQFKILLLTWKSLNGLAPSFISQLLTPYVPTRTLRSSDKLLLKIPKTFSSYGDRAFSSCAPKLWNSLPMDIRSCVSINAFKNRLKTYLFQTAYNV